MNRRDAIKALTSLPGLATVSVATVQPHDVIVAEADSFLSSQAIEHIHAKLQEIWPGRKVVVCDAGLKLKVMRSQP